MNDQSVDLQFKMSKKIAQLTKVIFHLHSRNEESEEIINAVKLSYEKEFENINSQNNNIISNYKDQIQKLISQNPQGKIKELQAKHDAEKLSSQKEYEVLQMNIEQKEKKIIKDKDEEILVLRKEIDTIQNKMESRLKDAILNIKSNFYIENESNQKIIEELKKAHKIEIENHVKEHNQKYQDLLKEKLMMEDKLKAEFEKEKIKLLTNFDNKLSEAINKSLEEQRIKLEKIMLQQVK